MQNSPASGHQPSPALFFETVQGYQRTYALKAAVDLDLFTAIAKGSQTASAIAKACQATERGVRILCDCLTVLGFIRKTDGRYSLTPDTAVFLDSRSPAYTGKSLGFLLHADHWQNFERLAQTVRTGSLAEQARSTLSVEDPIWVDFARGMSPLTTQSAQSIVEQLRPPLAKLDSPKILDIAAGHGMFGIAIARQFPGAQIYGQDWGSVLKVAQENAQALGVADRYHQIAGSAFEVDFGHGYDAVLLTNFLHHFDPPANETLLKKVLAALNPGGQVVVLEFVPNDDRISPPQAALFSLVMLGNTGKGDAYTFAELARMCINAGLRNPQLVAIEPGFQSLVVAEKAVGN
ncbi:MAG TPA: class I SAM-dependent methyltransferase [Candidatus Solibacter sp.]|nr:class I SAM-dependent methyltransferase [Candidatus Solibacter sp.]